MEDKALKTMKLFAVVALVGACDKGPEPKRPAAKPSMVTQPTTKEKPVTPRTLGNGRPACGNVASKGPRPKSPDCEER